MAPDRADRLPVAPAAAGIAAVVVAAVGLGDGGLLVPAGAPSPSASALLRLAGVATAGIALAALARRHDIGLRRLPGVLAAAGAVGTTVALLTLPVSDVTVDWGTASPRTLPPAGTPPPGAGAAAPAPAVTPPPVLRIPLTGRLRIEGDVLVLVMPDGTRLPLGSADAGEEATPLPAGGTLDVQVAPDGGVSVVDGTGGVVAGAGATGPGLDLGDVSIRSGAGDPLVDVTGGQVQDTGGAASGQVEVAPVVPDETGRDVLATTAGLAMAAAAYWLVFLHRGRYLTRPRSASPTDAPPADDQDGLPRPADSEAAGAGLVTTLERMLSDPDPRTAIVGAYAHLLATLEDAGLGRRAPEAPHEHLRRALQPLGARPEPVHALADLFVLARFGDAPLTDEHRDAAIAALRAAIGDIQALVPA